MNIYKIQDIPIKEEVQKSEAEREKSILSNMNLILQMSDEIMKLLQVKYNLLNKDISDKRLEILKCISEGELDNYLVLLRVVGELKDLYSINNKERI